MKTNLKLAVAIFAAVFIFSGCAENSVQAPQPTPTPSPQISEDTISNAKLTTETKGTDLLIYRDHVLLKQISAEQLGNASQRFVVYRAGDGLHLFHVSNRVLHSCAACLIWIKDSFASVIEQSNGTDSGFLVGKSGDDLFHFSGIDGAQVRFSNTFASLYSEAGGGLLFHETKGLIDVCSKCEIQVSENFASLKSLAPSTAGGNLYGKNGDVLINMPGPSSFYVTDSFGFAHNSTKGVVYQKDRGFVGEVPPTASFLVGPNRLTVTDGPTYSWSIDETGHVTINVPLTFLK